MTTPADYGLNLASQLIAHANGYPVRTGLAEQVIDALRDAGLILTSATSPAPDLLDIVAELESDEIEHVEWRDRRRYARILRAHRCGDATCRHQEARLPALSYLEQESGRA